jgi:DNA-binding transcriptional LysR family regulator
MNAVHSRSLQRAPLDQLAQLDLNLMVAFDALAHERSVTLAARRLGVTQSAMSHALRRLRDLLSDPLMVRGRDGLMLTPRAESLVVPLRSGLLTLARALVEPGDFEPASAVRTFSLASPDLFDVLVVPALLERIRRDAPGVDVNVVPLAQRRLSELLATGEVDAAITPQIDDFRTGEPELPTSDLVRRTLLYDHFVCLLRRDHPALRGKSGALRKRRSKTLSLEAYAALSHAVVSPSGGGRGVVDQALAEHGLERRIALRIPHFYTALAIVAKSDLVLTAPSALAGLAPRDHALVALRPPLALPRNSVSLVWHARFSKDPGHIWLRGLLAELTRAVGGRPLQDR